MAVGGIAATLRAVSHKHHFRRFLEAWPERIHFAAHRHHFWPDVSFDAHAEAWLDAARFADQKWERIFAEVLPRAQRHVAKRLAIEAPGSVTFAATSDELFGSVLASLPRRAIRILTTDSELRSFARRVAPGAEDVSIEVTRVEVEPRATFAERFADAASKPGWDLVYLSHVFGDSGYAVPDLRCIVERVPAETCIVVDGHHAFGAIAIDLSAIERRVFYLAGGHAYAMSGEGCSFLHAPTGEGARASDAGWFSAFDAVAESGARAGGGRRLRGTFDPSALYRFDAVMSWLDAENLDATSIHAHGLRLQELFVEELEKETLPLRERQLVIPLGEKSRGQFLTFATAAAADIHQRLLGVDVVTDARGDRLRFGFGLYHDESDIGRGIARMCRALG